MTVNPGDLIFGDADGVVVVARGEIAKVLAACKARVKKEKVIMEKLRKAKRPWSFTVSTRVLEARGLKEE